MRETRRDAYSFARDECQAFELALAPIDWILRAVASDYGMRWQAYASRGWPGRTLRKRRLLKTYFLRISLDPDYVRSGRIAWQIVEMWMYDYGELINKTISYRVVAEFSDWNVRAREAVTTAVAEALGRRKQDVPE